MSAPDLASPETVPPHDESPAAPPVADAASVRVVERADQRSPAGLYLHIPFCTDICHYCHFNRQRLDAALKRAYVDALVEDIGRQGTGGVADTIFFGGGTPSLLSDREVGRLIEACGRAFTLAPSAEITLETNPETVSGGQLAAFRAAGVTRVSFGVQSFLDEELRRLGRVHDAARARAAVTDALAAGFDAVSLDLMMWLPGQRLSAWLASVGTAIALAPHHLSLYMLELYPNAPLRDEMARGGWTLAADEEAVAMYEGAFERLAAAGYDQYEISNAARPGRRARHNLKYWSDGDWFGFGCGAHGTVGPIRWHNVAGIGDYLERVRAGRSTVASARRLPPKEQMEDALVMGMRLLEGIDVVALGARYGVDVMSRYGTDLADLIDQDVVSFDGTRLRLTSRGRVLSNEVMRVFV